MALDGDGGVHFEKVEDGVYAVIATAEDVQVGWCRQQGHNWGLFDMDEKLIGGEFDELIIAKEVGLKLFAHLAGSGNPAH